MEKDLDLQVNLLKQKRDRILENIQREELKIQNIDNQIINIENKISAKSDIKELDLSWFSEKA